MTNTRPAASSASLGRRAGVTPIPTVCASTATSSRVRGSSARYCGRVTDRGDLAVLTALSLLLAGCAIATPNPSGSAVPTATILPTPTSAPSDVAGADLPLDELAWWDQEYFGFGYIPEFTPPPNPEVNPRGGNFVRLGTLDGRLTGVVLLHWDIGHSYVTGPVGTDVVFADDDGRESMIFIVSALDGARSEVFRSPEILPAATLSPDGETIYYGMFDRATGADLGLWRVRRAGGSPERVHQSPLGGPLSLEVDNLVNWRMTFSADGSVLAIQSCVGEGPCATTFLTIATGEVVRQADLPWIRGVTADEFVARRTDETIGINVGTLEATPFVGGIGSLSMRTDERLGFGLPTGWTLSWPDPMWAGFLESFDAIGSPTLRNYRSGDAVGLPPFVAVVAAADCDLLSPAVLPGGGITGAHLTTLESGIRQGEWGFGHSEVRQQVGQAHGSVPGTPVVIRGHAGTASIATVGLTTRGTLAWDDGGCGYRLWLAPGSTEADAVEFAPKF